MQAHNLVDQDRSYLEDHHYLWYWCGNDQGRIGEKLGNHCSIWNHRYAWYSQANFSVTCVSLLSLSNLFLDFLKAYSTAGGDTSLIGQFGVGFYSAFLVADTVTVVSKHNDDKQHIWRSDAQGSFTVIEDPRGNTLGRGTSITLFIKEDQEQFLDEDAIKALVKKYSEFITFPIYLWASHEEDKEVPLTEEELKAEKEKKEEEEEEIDIDKNADEKKEEEEKPKTKTVKEKVFAWELMNQNKPIWTRNPKDVTDEEYNKFYKSFTKVRIE